MQKGQLVVEWIVVIAAVLIIIVPLFYVHTKNAGETVSYKTLVESVNVLSSGINQIYTLGPGSKKYVLIELPNAVKSSSIDGNNIIFTMSFEGKIKTVSLTSVAELNGSLPEKGGLYKIFIQKMSNNLIYVGNYTDESPPRIIAKSPEGTIDYPNIIMTATTDKLAVCKYDIYNRTYDLMQYDFNGIDTAHSINLGILDKGYHKYYARCLGRNGLVMNESEIIDFTINITITLCDDFFLDEWSDGLKSNITDFPYNARKDYTLYLALPLNISTVSEANFDLQGIIR